MTERALTILCKGKSDAYSKALAVLHANHREPYKPEPHDLQRFLEDEVMPWYRRRRSELENRDLIRAQAFGEALKPDRLEKLARYEVHLDRKLERILGMLLKLRDLRRTITPGPTA